MRMRLAPIDSIDNNLIPPAASTLAALPVASVLQRLPGVWCIVFLLLVSLGPVFAPLSFAAMYFVFHILFLANNIRMAYAAVCAHFLAKTHSKTDWAEKFCKQTGAASPSDPSAELPFDEILHLIIVPNYKEELETLSETLETLASHTYALTQYKVCLAMEASEENSHKKAQMLITQFGDSFRELVFTIHPVGLPGEIRGKSSNVAWAAHEMARRSPAASRARQILTVMDADTAFAQDYFAAVAYHYAVATPDERKIMMFAPCTVFDRNAKNVPIFVRVADMVWSAGVIANHYPSSPIKVPCSAYSLSMDLAVAVNFWDTDPTAIGEDMHMYLKCFFATEGRLIVLSIFSPASQCNVQGSSWLATARDRYIQSKRHMWGSLDVGYIVRRSLFALFAPGYDAPNNILQEVPLIRPVSTIGSQDIQIKIPKLLHLIHRIFEANMIMGQVFVLVFITSLIIPVPNSPSPFAQSIWSSLTRDPVHPYVELATSLGGYIRMVATIPFLTMVYHYEKYMYWVSTERWIWSLREQVRPGSGHHVQPLGKRPQLVSQRGLLNLIDWIALPVCGLVYLAIPQIQVHIMQLWTDRLEYKVAGKPSLANTSHVSSSDTIVAAEDDSISASNGRDSTGAAKMDVITVRVAESGPSSPKTNLQATEALSAATNLLAPPIRSSSLLTPSTSINTLCEDMEMTSVVSSRGDSGFFDFDDGAVVNGASISPSLWKQFMPMRFVGSARPHDTDSQQQAATRPSRQQNQSASIQSTFI